MLKSWGTFIALSLLGFSAFDANAGQTMDCGSAKKSSEKAICDHEKLIKMDERVNDGYLSVIAFVPNDLKRQLRWEQRAWMITRNKCGYSSLCIEDSYKRRLSRLAVWERQYKAK